MYAKKHKNIIQLSDYNSDECIIFKATM